mgnify:FL=1
MLVEEKNQVATNIAIAFIDEFVQEHYPSINEDYEMTEQDYAAFECMVQHFVENYKLPNIFETVTEMGTGIDKNQNLFDELYETLLDESVGTFVAGAVHGIRNYLSGKKVQNTQKKADDAKKKYIANKIAATSGGGGFLDSAKRGYAKARQKSLGANYGRKVAVANAAKAAHAANKQSTSALAGKITKKISDVGNRIGSTVGNAVSRVS